MMQLLEVNTPETEALFIKVAVLMYKNDPNWIRPLDKDIQEVFNPKKNKAYRLGTAIRWVLVDENQHPIGRIAAFVSQKYKNKGDDCAVGGIGFFECINDFNAAKILLDGAKKWLQEKGMEAMDGPINFGERDRWWGMVTAGFEAPLYCMNYNPPYYVALFEQYGFKPFFHQICFGLDPLRPLTAKIHERHNAFKNNPDFSATHYKKKQITKFASDFVTVYNKAWAGHGGLKELSKEQAIIIFKSMTPVMDERIIWFAYHKDEPVAIFVNLPDLNQWFKYLNGQFGLFHKLKFLLVKQFVANPKCNGLVFGVVPEWQGKGIDAYIIGEAATRFFQTPRSPYKKYEMQWIGDFNPKMINVAENLGETYRSRNLTTFRNLFDPTKPFQRHPMLA